MIAWTLLILSGSVILAGLLYIVYTCVREALKGDSEARMLLWLWGAVVVIFVFLGSLVAVTP